MLYLSDPWRRKRFSFFKRTEQPLGDLTAWFLQRKWKPVRKTVAQSSRGRAKCFQSTVQGWDEGLCNLVYNNAALKKGGKNTIIVEEQICISMLQQSRKPLQVGDWIIKDRQFGKQMTAVMCYVTIHRGEGDQGGERTKTETWCCWWWWWGHSRPKVIRPVKVCLYVEGGGSRWGHFEMFIVSHSFRSVEVFRPDCWPPAWVCAGRQ